MSRTISKVEAERDLNRKSRSITLKLSPRDEEHIARLVRLTGWPKSIVLRTALRDMARARLEDVP